MGRRFHLLASLFLLTVVFLAGCTGQSSQPPSSQGTQELSQNKAEASREAAQLKEFTHEELARYDGSDGKPAYVALNGLVYDVTSHKGWKEGVHSPWSYKRVAGSDLTFYFSKAPASHRQKDFFADVPVVGRYTDPPGPSPGYEDNR